MHNEMLSIAYDDIDPAKADRLRNCATWLRYGKTDGGVLRLAEANFCRVRLCPVCQWRRSLKAYAQTQQVIRAYDAEAPHSYAMLTLTVSNCSGDELGGTIDAMMRGWDRLSRRAPWRRVVLGWYRGLEITHNTNPYSSSYDTYHPHFHVLLALRKSYWTSRDYMRHDDWVELWRQSMRLDYVPIVDIRKCKTTIAASIAEVCKYSTKASDYIIADDWDMTVATVRLLDAVLNGRKFTAYGGELARIHKALHLDDVDDGDLVHADDDAAAVDTQQYVLYSWYSGFRQYYKE